MNLELHFTNACARGNYFHIAISPIFEGAPTQTLIQVHFLCVPFNRLTKCFFQRNRNLGSGESSALMFWTKNCRSIDSSIGLRKFLPSALDFQEHQPGTSLPPTWGFSVKFCSFSREVEAHSILTLQFFQLSFGRGITSMGFENFH